MKNLALAYTALVLSIIAAVFLLSDVMNANAITGMAITDISEKPLGTYEIYPHISTDIGFSIDHYKKLRVDARKLLDLVKRCDMEFFASQCTGDSCAMDMCIQSALETLSLDWQPNCGRGKEGFFYGFSEFYMRCSQSADDDCVCRMDYTGKEYNPGEYLVSVIPFGERAVIESRMMRSVEIDAVPMIQDVGGFAGSHKDYGRLDFLFVFGTGSQSKSELIVFSNRFDLKGSLFLHKLGRNLAVVVPNDQEIYKEKKTCSLPKKTTYIFCAPSEQVTATDASGRASEQSLSYRFALEP